MFRGSRDRPSSLADRACATDTTSNARSRPLHSRPTDGTVPPTPASLPTTPSPGILHARFFPFKSPPFLPAREQGSRAGSASRVARRRPAATRAPRERPVTPLSERPPDRDRRLTGRGSGAGVEQGWRPDRATSSRTRQPSSRRPLSPCTSPVIAALARVQTWAPRGCGKSSTVCPVRSLWRRSVASCILRSQDADRGVDLPGSRADAGRWGRAFDSCV